MDFKAEMNELVKDRTAVVQSRFIIDHEGAEHKAKLDIFDALCDLFHEMYSSDEQYDILEDVVGRLS